MSARAAMRRWRWLLRTNPRLEQEDDITLVALERAAADPAVPRPVELGRPATAAAAIPLVAGGAGPAGPARRVLVEEPTGTAADAAMAGMRAGRHGG